MTSPLNFTPDAIRNDAAAIAALPMHAEFVQVLAPCALDSAESAASTLNRDAENLIDEQNQLTEERNRICDYMCEGASRYMGTVEASAEALNGTVGGGAGMSTAGSAPLTPPSLNPFFPPLPRRPLTPPPAATAPGGYSEVPTTEAAISAPDTGTSLGAALTAWMANASTLQSTAAALPMAFSDWEGRAAEAASARIRALKAKLMTLAEDWQALAAKGNGFLGAHTALKASHHSVYEEYVALKLAWEQAFKNNNADALAAITQRLQQTQQESDEIRREYEQAAQLPPGPVPHDSGGKSTTSESGGRPTQRGNREQRSIGNSAAASDSGEIGPSPGTRPGQPGSGSPDATGAPTRPESLPEGNEGKQLGQPPSGGAPPGGLPSGGPPPGAGMPGGLPGTMPGAGTPEPKPLSPPAGAGGGKGGGGAGAGGGGKGAGGGMGGRPLSPAAVAVGPTPTSQGAGPGPGTPDRAPVGTGAVGAGMPMMGHGAGHNQGKEKKRSPERSPDESVYTEDRPWTEGVVGHSRREVQGRREPTPASRAIQGRREAEGDHGSKDTT
ncbi:MAG: hypothetical protein KDB71_14680 [Mycobacterium sp.]|nr:hypothetical protein [Mycobacterium sp.]